MPQQIFPERANRVVNRDADSPDSANEKIILRREEKKEEGEKKREREKKRHFTAVYLPLRGKGGIIRDYAGQRVKYMYIARCTADFISKNTSSIILLHSFVPVRTLRI